MSIGAILMMAIGGDDAAVPIPPPPPPPGPLPPVDMTLTLTAGNFIVGGWGIVGFRDGPVIGSIVPQNLLGGVVQRLSAVSDWFGNLSTEFHVYGIHPQDAFISITVGATTLNSADADYTQFHEDPDVAQWGWYGTGLIPMTTTHTVVIDAFPPFTLTAMFTGNYLTLSEYGFDANAGIGVISPETLDGSAVERLVTVNDSGVKSTVFRLSGIHAADEFTTLTVDGVPVLFVAATYSQDDAAMWTWAGVSLFHEQVIYPVTLSIPATHTLTAGLLDLGVDGNQYGFTPDIGSVTPATVMGGDIQVLVASVDNVDIVIMTTLSVLGVHAQDAFTSLSVNGMTLLSAEAMYLQLLDTDVAFWTWNDVLMFTEETDYLVLID